MYSRRTRVILGVLSFFPIIYVVFLVGFGLLEEKYGPLSGIDVLFRLTTIVILEVMGLVVFSLIHIFKNPRLTTGKHVVWTLIIVLWQMLTIPIYWYIHIWRVPRFEAP